MHTTRINAHKKIHVYILNVLKGVYYAVSICFIPYLDDW